MQVKSALQFQTNLRYALEQMGVSQRAIAQKADISYPYVNRILNGVSTPSIDVCESIASAMGLEFKDFLVTPAQFRKHLKNLSVST